ncbi:hypothetical protein Q3G72_023258 [Acer saccharum]|nr:hypothetical protein Q3G72_023258 [Acer saccharum]
MANHEVDVVCQSSSTSVNHAAVVFFKVSQAVVVVFKVSAPTSSSFSRTVRRRRRRLQGQSPSSSSRCVLTSSSTLLKKVGRLGIWRFHEFCLFQRGGILKDVFCWSEQYLMDYLSTCCDEKQNKKLPIHPVRIAWKPPRMGVYKANCDAMVDKIEA